MGFVMDNTATVVPASIRPADKVHPIVRVLPSLTDLTVILILVFVLATPRAWFHDQPQMGLPAKAPGQVVLFKDEGESKTYRVDARVHLGNPVDVVGELQGQQG